MDKIQLLPPFLRHFEIPKKGEFGESRINIENPFQGSLARSPLTARPE